MRYRGRNLDPYRARAKWNGTCPKCGRTIPKGAEIIVWPAAPRGRKAMHPECCEQEWKRFLIAREEERAIRNTYGL